MQQSMYAALSPTWHNGYYILTIDMVCHMADPKGKVGTNRCYVELIDLHVLSLLGNKFVQQDDGI